MKLYIKTRNRFFALSILVIIVAFITLFKFQNQILGNFLLGIFASTFIITIQYDLASKVEESKLLIDKLKILRNKWYTFHEFKSFSLEHFAYNFEEKYNKFKDELNEMFSVNDELGNIVDLNSSTKKELNKIIEKINSLEINLHFIIKNFDQASNKMKIIYFIEFYKILKDFDFEQLNDMVKNLGYELDSREFYKRDYKKQKQIKMENLEYDTSINVYNKKLEEKNSIEYKALKKEFEQYLK